MALAQNRLPNRVGVRTLTNRSRASGMRFGHRLHFRHCRFQHICQCPKDNRLHPNSIVLVAMHNSM